MTPYRTSPHVPLELGDEVEFIKPADYDASVPGAERMFPDGTFQVTAIRIDGWVMVKGGWTSPEALRRTRPVYQRAAEALPGVEHGGCLTPECPGWKDTGHKSPCPFADSTDTTGNTSLMET